MGEHTTEARAVGGSIPSISIFFSNIYKCYILITNMPKEGKGDNNFGLASVILGIIGSVLGVLVFPIVISIIGLIFGIIQIRKQKNKWAIWGIVLSALGIIISIYVLWTLVSALSGLSDTIAMCQADPTLPGCEAIAGTLGA